MNVYVVGPVTSTAPPLTAVDSSSTLIEMTHRAPSSTVAAAFSLTPPHAPAITQELLHVQTPAALHKETL